MKVCTNCSAKNDTLASACIACGHRLYDDTGRGIIPQPPSEVIHRVSAANIAYGVFLGNLLTTVVAVLVWFIFLRSRF